MITPLKVDAFGALDLTGVPKVQVIQEAFIKTKTVVDSHEKILVKVSGGYDSDLILDMICRVPGGKEKSTFVFNDTGLEYDATKRHIEYLQQQYGIDIITLKPKMAIPTCVKEFGVPFMSKFISEKIYYLQLHDFNWVDGDFDELCQSFPRTKSSMKWWCNQSEQKYSYYNISRTANLKEFMMQNPPKMKISAACCEKAKKQPTHRFETKFKPDLVVTGLRKSEGGVRSLVIKSCYESKVGEADSYRPIFWFSDEDKKVYKDFFGITLSDCYELWGMSRTGCAGCPYNSKINEELDMIAKYEPNRANAMFNVFGESYKYREEYKRFRESMKKKNR